MNDPPICRRRFLSLMGAAGACTFIGARRGMAMCGGGMMGGMMNAGMAGVIDPPPGDAFINPSELSNQSTIPANVEVSIEAKISPVNIGGINANLYTYNGGFPGPTVRVKRGDRLTVNFKNSFPRTNTFNMLGHERDHTNFHTHGFHVSPMGNSDNVMLEFDAGQKFKFEYDLSYQYPGSMCFYHPHVHGSVSEQYWGGQAGVLIVDDGLDVLAGYDTKIMVLKDLALVNGAPTAYTHHMDYMNGKEGPLVMVNGQINPRLAMRPGEVQRWRILNASTARFYNLSLTQHSMYLIGTDSGLIDKPYPLNRILLSPGERIDLLVKAGSNPGNYKFVSLPYNRGGHGHMMMGGGGQSVTLMTMVCDGEPMKADIPPVINPDAKRMAVDYRTVPRYQMVLGMHMHAGFINGKTFGPDPYVVNSKLGSFEIWDLINRSPMDHPLHHHVNAAQVLAINGGDPEYAALYSSIPCLKDTTLVPRFGSVTLLMPITDWPGMSMMHCHIIEHEDIGMMGVWNIA